MAENKNEVYENIKKDTISFVQNIDYQGIKDFLLSNLKLYKELLLKPDRNDLKPTKKQSFFFLSLYFIIIFCWLMMIPKLFVKNFVKINLQIPQVALYTIIFLFIEFILLQLLLFKKERKLSCLNGYKNLVLSLMPAMTILLIALILSLFNPYLLIVLSIVALVANETSFSRLTTQNSYYGYLFTRIIVSFILVITTIILIYLLIKNASIEGLNLDFFKNFY